MKRNIIITSVAPLALAALAFAHGGFDHVQGTVVKVENNVLTVKTTKGDEMVKLDAKTEITRGDHAAKVADLKAGARVIVDIEEGDKTHTAHSIKLGATAAVAAHEHDDDHASHK
jgi:hypothetical protein